MISLNEVVSLINQIDAAVDDAGGEILGYFVHKHNKSIHLDSTAFLKEFVDFKMEITKEKDWAYCLNAEIQGVEFFALMNAEEILKLKESIPEQFEYIQSIGTGPNCNNCECAHTEYRTYPEPNGYGWGFKCFICGHSESGFEA